MGIRLAALILASAVLSAPSYQRDDQVDADVSTHTGTDDAHHTKGATAAEANSISDHETRVTTLEGQVTCNLIESPSPPGATACEPCTILIDSGTPSICHCTTTDTWACVTTTIP